jgi:hypothetical protein
MRIVPLLDYYRSSCGKIKREYYKFKEISLMRNVLAVEQLA